MRRLPPQGQREDLEGKGIKLLKMLDKLGILEDVILFYIEYFIKKIFPETVVVI